MMTAIFQFTRTLVVMSIIVLVLAVATMLRNSVWHDSTILWEDAVRKGAQKARTFNNLGNAYMDHDIDRAITAYESALERNPSYEEANYNMAMALASQGQHEASLSYFLTALDTDPDNAKAHLNAGTSYFALDQINRAIYHFQAALFINPNYAKAHYDLGICYGKKGMLLEAEKEFRRAATLSNLDHPGH